MNNHISQQLSLIDRYDIRDRYWPVKQRGFQWAVYDRAEEMLLSDRQAEALGDAVLTDMLPTSILAERPGVRSGVKVGRVA